MTKKSASPTQTKSGDPDTLALVAETMPYSFALFDENDRIVLFNSAYQKLSGLSKKYLSGKPTFLEIIQHAVPLGKIADAQKNPEKWLKKRIRHHRKPEAPFEISYVNGSVLLVHENRKKNGYTTMRFDDITELRSEQRNSREVSERARVIENQMFAAIESISDGFAIFDPKGKLILCNSKYRESNSITPHEYKMGQSYKSILETCATETFGTSLKKEKNAWIKWRLSRQSEPGSPAEYHYPSGKWLRYSDFHTADGNHVVTFSNITEQKQQEQAILEGEARVEAARNLLEVAVNNMAGDLVMYDARNRLVICNSNFEKSHKDFPRTFEKGITIAETIRILLEGDFFGKTDDSEAFLKKRIATMKKPGVREITFPDGHFEQARTSKMRDGGIVIVRTDITELKKITDDLARREEHLRGIMDIVLDAIITINGRGIIDTFNPAAERIFGYTSKEIAGENINKLMPAPERKDHDTYISNYLDTGEASIIGIGREVMGQRKDGSVFPMELSVSEGHLAGGKFFIGTIRDITERKKAEEILRRSESDVRSILDNLQDTFFRTDLSGAVIMISPSAFDLTGYTVEELIGRNIIDLYVNPEAVTDIFNLIYEGNGNSVEYEVQIRCKEDREKWLSVNARLLVDANGKSVGVEGVARDITERKTAEEALKLSEERFALAMKASDEGIWDWDMEADITHLSQRAMRILHLETDQIPTENMAFNALHPDDKKPYVDGLIAHLKGQTPDFECEFRLKGNDGKYYWVQNRSIALRRPNGRAYRMIGSLGDINDRKRSEVALRDALEQAEIANRTKTEFLANVSHELRTPLNAIIGFSDLISSEIFGPIGSEKYRDYTESISASGLHLLDIINDILDISRIEVGKLDFRPERVQLAPVFEACLRMIKERAAKADLTVRRSIQGNLPDINADPRRIKQILLNLLSNAVKFTPRNGTIHLRARIGRNGTLSISVSDTGIGMNESDIPKVMMPFVQIDSKLSRSYEGTGLGLPLTKSFVDMHGGEMSIKSAPNKGTTITVRLPADILLP